MGPTISTSWKKYPVLSDTSYSSPALANFQGSLWLAWTGTNENLNIESTTDGVNFYNRHYFSSETASGGPALANFPGPSLPTLELGWAGTDSPSHLNFLQSTDGTNWVNHTTLNEFPHGHPALSPCSFCLYPLRVDYADGGTSKIYDQGSNDGINFAAPSDTGAASNRPPSLAIYQNSIYLGWVYDIQGHLEVMQLSVL